MSAPAIVRARREPSAPSTHLGQVAYVEDDYRARVNIGAGTITAHIPSAHRAIRDGDSVRVTWQGGDPVVTEVITRHPAPTYPTASGVSTNRSLATAPPAAVDLPSGSTQTLPTTSLTAFYHALPSTATLATVIVWLNAVIVELDSHTEITDASRVLLQGSSGSTGLRSLASGLRTATNTQTTVVAQHRNYLHTQATDLTEQGIVKR